MSLLTNESQRVNVDISALHKYAGGNDKYVKNEMLWYVILFL